MQLLGSTAHLLGQPQLIETQLGGLLERHKDMFTAEQSESLVSMTAVAAAKSQPSDAQRESMTRIREQLGMPPAGDGVWESSAAVEPLTSRLVGVDLCHFAVQFLHQSCLANI